MLLFVELVLMANQIKGGRPRGVNLQQVLPMSPPCPQRMWMVAMMKAVQMPKVLLICLSLQIILVACTIECFLLNKAEKVNKTMTMVGKVSDKHGKGIIQTLCMFDQCSTDPWVPHSLAKQLKAKRLDDWYGWVKTINGAEERTLAVYEITIKKVEATL
jgi:hypothetical protein